MLTLIEALHFRSLKYNRQALGPFHVLVGPNAGGKSTFLDVAAFLSRLVNAGPEAAVYERSQDFRDLVWRRGGEGFELAVEARIPEECRLKLANPECDTVRYEVAVGAGPDGGEVALLAERAVLKGPPAAQENPQRELFPMPVEAPKTLLSARAARGMKTVVNKNPDGHDNYYDETGKGWDHSFRLGARKSALANLPDDESRFPVAAWLKAFLAEGIRPCFLSSAALRQASPPGESRGFKADGSNLAWLVAALEKCEPRFQEWLARLRAALPEIEDIRTTEAAGDRRRYLTIRYRDGLETPSWAASDGTLRLVALTLLGFLPDFRGVYLVEEPENGIHPRGVQAVYQALCGARGPQVLLATHSPVILGMADPAQVLFFAKSEEGATDIVSGREHPALRNWQGEINLSALFAAGVLG